ARGIIPDLVPGGVVPAVVVAPVDRHLHLQLQPAHDRPRFVLWWNGAAVCASPRVDGRGRRGSTCRGGGARPPPAGPCLLAPGAENEAARAPVPVDTVGAGPDRMRGGRGRAATRAGRRLPLPGAGNRRGRAGR